MADSKFSLDGPAFEDPTRLVIRPDHIMPVQEEAGVGTQIFWPPSPPEERNEPAANAPENLLLRCIMEDTGDHLHTFQEYEHYVFGDNSRSDCDPPEDEHTDEMEDILSDKDQLVPENLQAEKGPTEV